MKFLMLIFCGWVRRRERKSFRMLIRGYRKLKSTNQLSNIYKIKEILSKTEIVIPQKFSRYFFGAGLPNAEIAIRQRLLVEIAHSRLSRALLIASASFDFKVRAPLPREWRRIISEQGFTVDHLICKILWQLFICLNFAKGILIIFRRSIEGIKNSLISVNSVSVKHIFFCNLSADNIPTNQSVKQKYDFISWYLQWQGRSNSLESIHHNVPNVASINFYGTSINYKSSPVPPLNNFFQVFRFIFWSINSILITFWDCIRGCWWSPLMLRDASDAVIIRFLEVFSLPSEYYFNNTQMMYRPLWTYEAEAKGVLLTYYFYSTNNELFNQVDGSKSPNFGFYPLTWPKYLVWDEFQAEFVKNNDLNNGDIEVVGPIWFSDNGKEVGLNQIKSIAIFDTQPLREHLHCLVAAPLEYHVPAISKNFFYDINEVANNLGIQILIKRKRNIGKKVHPSYTKVMESLSRESHISIIDSGVSAIRLIQSKSVEAVVCQPFSSVALIASMLKKSVIYYDPSGVISKNDYGAHGIPVITGIRDLESWMQKV
jgi:polysaccharide biosynthesis PFTS motif protein